MLVLGIASVPGVGLRPLGPPHCFHREMSAMGAHDAHFMSASSSARLSGEFSTWSRPTSHECTHCPPSDCGLASVCSNSTVVASSPSTVAVTISDGQGTVVDRTENVLLSTASPPDPPPPRLIA